MVTKIYIPKGCLAADDAAMKAKREALKKKLIESGKVTWKKDGNVMDDKDQGVSIILPKCKLD